MLNLGIIYHVNLSAQIAQEENIPTIMKKARIIMKQLSKEEQSQKILEDFVSDLDKILCYNSSHENYVINMVDYAIILLKHKLPINRAWYNDQSPETRAKLDPYITSDECFKK